MSNNSRAEHQSDPNTDRPSTGRAGQGSQELAPARRNDQRPANRAPDVNWSLGGNRRLNRRAGTLPHSRSTVARSRFLSMAAQIRGQRGRR
jgi:hypothetical protein